MCDDQERIDYDEYSRPDAKELAVLLDVFCAAFKLRHDQENQEAKYAFTRVVDYADRFFDGVSGPEYHPIYPKNITPEAGKDKILRGYREIAKEFRVSDSRVVEWVSCGAPIRNVSFGPGKNVHTGNSREILEWLWRWTIMGYKQKKENENGEEKKAE